MHVHACVHAENIERAFKLADKDGNGLLSRAELLCTGMAASDVDSFMQRAGKKGKSAKGVSYAEFVSAVCEPSCSTKKAVVPAEAAEAAFEAAPKYVAPEPKRAKLGAAPLDTADIPMATQPLDKEWEQDGKYTKQKMGKRRHEKGDKERKRAHTKRSKKENDDSHTQQGGKGAVDETQGAPEEQTTIDRNSSPGLSAFSVLKALWSAVLGQ